MSVTYTMTISRMTVDKLGVKLYDKVSAVIAELVANSYDADATRVEIRAPLGEFLASKQNGQIMDKGYTIEVQDDGIGMTPEQVNEFYLRVGAERRIDSRRGDTSKKFNRKVMGRKGVGKLAPFGICYMIEVITSGGELVDGKDENGNNAKGYLTAHLTLERDEILSDTDEEYKPVVGPLDETVRPTTGTLLRLTTFFRRLVPNMEGLGRQMAQRFGITAPNWKIILIDSAKGEIDSDYSRQVGSFNLVKMEGTEICFDTEKEVDGSERTPLSYRAFAADGNIYSGLKAGFDHEGRFFPVTGWVAYAKDPYKDDLMAGVRIYCRRKIAAQTSIFNRGAGFTGEYDIRSYLIGELHADWLDEEEDLIQTDRRDILWSHELGQAFEQWGQSVIRKIGSTARPSIKKKTWETFQEVSKIEDKIDEAFPIANQKPIRENALEIAKLVGKTMREEEAKDAEKAASIVELSLTLAPHVTLDKKLREAADEKDSPLSVITTILKTARIAELSSFGQIADGRIKVIGRVETVKDDTTIVESVLQNLIQEAPWLIDPQWSPITSNQSFSTLKTAFQKYFKEKTGEDIVLDNFTASAKRADFVLSSQDNVVQIIEIKRPHHSFENEEMERLNLYVDQMTSFLEESNNREFRRVFSDFHATLVCDDEKLTGVHKRAFNELIDKRKLTYINWDTFLLRTKRMHQAFLAEAERQRNDAARGL